MLNSTQILLFPNSGEIWAPGEYTLVFHNHLDHGDEGRLNDNAHRYDRPVERNLFVAAEPAKIKITI